MTRTRTKAGRRRPSGTAAALTYPPPDWIALTYEPVAPFSLRPSHSTSAGGKTLLVPTPYAIKLALVDAEIRRSGDEAGERLLVALREAAIALLPSRRACVTHTFVRSLKLHQEKGKKRDEDDEEEAEADQGRPFNTTLRYREICVLSGPMVIAVGLRDPTLASAVDVAARHVNYFGKRGGFFQLRQAQVVKEVDPRSSVVDPLGWFPVTTPAGGVACVLDDLGPRATLIRVSPYTDQRSEWELDRVAAMRILAVRRIASGSHFTAYERIGE